MIEPDSKPIRRGYPQASRTARTSVLPAILTFACLVGCAKTGPARGPALGDPRQGAELLEREACGSCHIIPWMAVGVGVVGPPLTHMAARTMIAGVLPNTPSQMVRWLQSPQTFLPGSAMPDMGLSQQQARDIAAYLYTLR